MGQRWQTFVFPSASVASEHLMGRCVRTREPFNLAGNRKGANDMTDPKDPLKDGLTPPDYDEYGDVPESGENE